MDALGMVAVDGSKVTAAGEIIRDVFLDMARQPDDTLETHGLDTATRVCFYEQDFYVLSNFSAFAIRLPNGLMFPTSEHAYHWMKFRGAPSIQDMIYNAPSAHEAFKIAERCKAFRDEYWDSMKDSVMLDTLRLKVQQHAYVHSKLLATGNRELVENSWRDDYWGWGPNKNGQNMLGKLWMKLRDELRGVKA